MIAVVGAVTGAAPARDVDLVTLPPRDAVQLTIYNSEDLTLVKEIRSITFKKGLNRLQFSWANTLIDPTSVHFRPLEHAGEIEVLDTTFPGDRPQVLYWNIESAFEGQARVEVSYFTSGISWRADYVMITNPGETQATFDGYVTVDNRSGEDYPDAQVRLVVGVVNLVEKIQQLAQQPPAPETRRRNEQIALLGALKKADVDDLVAFGDFTGKPGSRRGRQPPKVVKEGLSEYFIFTVEGTQTITNGWSRRMVSFRAAQVPFEILYRYRPHQYGPKPVRFFILANDEEHKMGTSPLPDGVIRVFRQNQGGLNYYTTQSTKYIPIAEKVELNVGHDDQVVYERKVFDVARDEFVYEGDPLRVVGWDETRQWREEVRNYRAKPIVMEIRHVLPGDVEFSVAEPAAKVTLYDFRTPEYTVTVPARTKLNVDSRGTFHLGKNAKQNRVRIVQP
jgi:hypothetical protein